MFKVHGRISDVDPTSGFAFVVMTNEEDAERAVERLNEKPVSGRVLIVEKKRPRQPMTSLASTFTKWWRSVNGVRSCHFVTPFGF